MTNSDSKPALLFGKKNFTFILGGIGLIVLGYILMAGGKPESPDIYNPEVFNFRRMYVAPIVVLSGFAAVMVGIFVKSKSA